MIAVARTRPFLRNRYSDQILAVPSLSCATAWEVASAFLAKSLRSKVWIPSRVYRRASRTEPDWKRSSSTSKPRSTRWSTSLSRAAWESLSPVIDA